MQQVRAEAAHHRQSFLEFVRHNDDPTVTTVLLEDSAALIGLLLAGLGIGLHEMTGSAVWDAAAGLAIAALLGFVAFRLARSTRRLLVGAQADPRGVREIAAWLADQAAVDAVVDVLTLQAGADRILVRARLDVVDALDAAGGERAALEMDLGLREHFSDVVEAFLEPMPRHDPGVRRRVRERYGDAVADRLDDL